MNEWTGRVVGRFFAYCDGVYEVTSHDPDQGFWVEAVGDPSDRRCISERAIGRTFHERFYFPAEDRWAKALLPPLGHGAAASGLAYPYGCPPGRHGLWVRHGIPVWQGGSAAAQASKA